MERIEGIANKGREIIAGFRMAWAFGEGKKLVEEWDKYRAELHLAPGETPGTLTDDDEATIAYIIAAWKRAPSEVC